MMKRCLALAAVLAAATACPATAQTLQQKGYQAVEQRVGDVDPMHQSMRKIESGLYEYGQGSSVFRGPDAQRLYFITQGFALSYDRSQYFEFEDRRGQTYVGQEVPPNTVFHLGLPSQPPAPPRQPSPYEVNAQVDGRVTTGRRVFAEGSPTGYDAQRVARQQWVQYAAARQAQCDAVIAAIDRVIGVSGSQQP